IPVYGSLTGIICKLFIRQLRSKSLQIIPVSEPLTGIICKLFDRNWRIKSLQIIPVNGSLTKNDRFAYDDRF
ncbi:DKNYY family protein, partial [Shigella flexneri]|nr:DKNYY family protein [Shigella flexneri]